MATDEQRASIQAYLTANENLYTAEALRSQLVSAGHDAALVDQVLSQRRSTPAVASEDIGCARTKYEAAVYVQ